jgi:hypothetical protein
MDVMTAELLEASTAAIRGDIKGRHGVRREVAQVAAVCMKLLETLEALEVRVE